MTLFSRLGSLRGRKSPKPRISTPVPSPDTLALTAKHPSRAAYQANLFDFGRPSSMVGPEPRAIVGVSPRSHRAAAPGPPQPVFSIHKNTLLIIASQDEWSRADYLEMMPASERVTVELLMSQVYAEMERRGQELAKTHADTEKDPVVEAVPQEHAASRSSLTKLQKKIAGKKQPSEKSPVLPLPPPFSTTARKVSDPCSLPKSPLLDTPASPFEGGPTFASKTETNNNGPLQKSINQNFLDIVDDFIKQEALLQRQRNGTETWSDVARRLEAKNTQPFKYDPMRHTEAGGARTYETPILRVNSRDASINEEIFNGKDGALKFEEMPSDFKSSGSAPPKIIKSDTIVYHPKSPQGDQSMGDLLSPRREAPPPPPCEAADEDDEPATPRVTAQFANGMTRVNTMTNLHAPLENQSRVEDLQLKDDLNNRQSPADDNLAIGGMKRVKTMRNLHSQEPWSDEYRSLSGLRRVDTTNNFKSVLQDDDQPFHMRSPKWEPPEHKFFLEDDDGNRRSSIARKPITGYDTLMGEFDQLTRGKKGKRSKKSKSTKSNLQLVLEDDGSPFGSGEAKSTQSDRQLTIEEDGNAFGTGERKSAKTNLHLMLEQDGNPFGTREQASTESKVKSKGDDTEGDRYSNPDEITTPVPFRTTIAAGAKARHRRRHRVLADVENEINSGGLKANQRHSVLELNEHAVVSKRLEEAASKKQMTPEKEKKNQQRKNEYAKRLTVMDNHLVRMVAERAQLKKKIKMIDNGEYSSPKDDDEEATLIGRKGSEVYLHRATLTQFRDSEGSLRDMLTPKPGHLAPSGLSYGGSTRDTSPFASSPLALPPLDADTDTIEEAVIAASMIGESPSSMGIATAEKKSHPFRIPPQLTHFNSDGKIPSSPTNKFGTTGRIRQWDDTLSHAQSASYLVPDLGGDPNATSSSQPISASIHENELMALFQDANAPLSAESKGGLSPAVGADLKASSSNEGDIFSSGRGKGRKRSASEESKLKKLYAEQMNEQGVYTTPTINRGGDVLPPAPVFVRMKAFAAPKESTVKKSDHHELRLAKSALELTTNSKDGDDDLIPSPASFNSLTFASTATPPSQDPKRYMAPHGMAPSIKSMNLRGQKSASLALEKTLVDADDAEDADDASLTSTVRPRRHSEAQSFTPEGSPRERVVSAPVSSSKSPTDSVRSFLPNSRTIPRSLLGYYKIIPESRESMDRSPERMPYVENNDDDVFADDEEEKNFKSYAKKALEFADRRKSRYD